MALMIATLLMFSGCTATAPDKEGSNKSKYDDVMASETVADDNSEDTSNFVVIQKNKLIFKMDVKRLI